MKRPNMQVDEVRHVWMAVGITLSLAAYRISVECVGALRAALQPFTRLPVAEAVTNALFFWLLALLYVAYRQWRTALFRERELDVVISSISPDVLMVVKPDRRISMCNAGVKDMFGYETSEVIGKATDLLYLDRRTGKSPTEIRDSLQKVGFHIGTAQGRRRNGEVFPLEIITGNLRGGPGAVVLMRDITERKRMEEQLVQAKEDAEIANLAKGAALARLEESFHKLQDLEQLRDKLTHMIVHDMKSPLSSVGGLLGLLSEKTTLVLNDDQNEYIAECRRLVQRLQEMILSVLDVSRLEKKQMPLNFDVYDVERLAREAESVVHADACDVTMGIVSTPTLLRVRCDADIVRRVIANLLDNALKFTPAGGEISVRMQGAGDWVRVTIADTGTGIPPQHHRRIFERFVSVEAKRHSTGLGLTFCKLAVEAHGGAIGVESPASLWQDRPGVIGTTFWFTLPKAA